MHSGAVGWRINAHVDPRDMFRSNHPIKPAAGGHAASR
jgi:hypothetical protein